MEQINVCVVLVTFNRLEKLKKALESYDEMTVIPSKIIVVNNGSTDGTTEFLKEWQKNNTGYDRKVINMSYNAGGSGGFYEGFVEALKTKAEWIWVADDDAYPAPDAFEKMWSQRSDDIVAICTRIDTETGIDTWHRRRQKKGILLVKEECISEDEYKEVFDLQLFSYVGVMIRKIALDKAGLPEKDFFINYDDTEHSMRVVKEGRIICVPDASCFHDSPGVTSDVLSWKKYYAVRNKVYSYKKHFGKRYAFVMSVFYRSKAFLMWFKKKNKNEYLIVKKALKDAKSGKLGVDQVYVPGWH